MNRNLSFTSRALMAASTLVMLSVMPRPRVHAADKARPLFSQLPRFTAAKVPAMAPEELPIPPIVAKHPALTDLPEGGASMRPMLYVGEG